MRNRVLALPLQRIISESALNGCAVTAAEINGDFPSRRRPPPDHNAKQHRAGSDPLDVPILTLRFAASSSVSSAARRRIDPTALGPAAVP